MKKLFITLLSILTFSTASVFAQGAAEPQGKPTVYVDYFTRSTSTPFLWAEALRSSVIEGIQDLNRVILLDVDSQESLRIEQARRESGDLSADGDLNRVSAMQQLGANFIIQGTVTAFTTEKKRYDDGSIYYSATCAYTVKVIDPNNGSTVATKTFKHGQGITDIATGGTPDEAATRVAGQAKKAIREIIDEAFKLEGTILELSEVKKDEAKECYISIGAANGVGDDTHFKVFISRKVAGRDSRKEIGQMKVKAVEGDDITLCEIKKGGKEIKAAMDAGQTIVVVITQKPKSFFDKAAKGLNSL